MTTRDEETFVCPHCGADLPLAATFCPECGSDEETGWSEDAHYGGLDLPEPEDGEEEPAEPVTPSGAAGLLFKVAAVIVVVVILFFLLLGVW